MNHKGFAPILVVLIILALLVIADGVLYYTKVPLRPFIPLWSGKEQASDSQHPQKDISLTLIGIVPDLTGVYPQSQPSGPTGISFLPPGPHRSPVPKNTLVRIVFSEGLGPTATNGLRIVKDKPRLDNNSVVPSRVTIENHPSAQFLADVPGPNGTLGTLGTIIFQPLDSCGDTANQHNCFMPGSYRLELDPSFLVSQEGSDHYVCDDSVKGLWYDRQAHFMLDFLDSIPPDIPPCTFGFTVDDTMANTSPEVSMNRTVTLPAINNADFPVGVRGQGYTYFAKFTLNQGQPSERYLGAVFGQDGEYGISATFNTSYLQKDMDNVVTVNVIDGAGHQSEVTTSVSIYPEHCFNEKQDKDESAIDCGGKDCAVCRQ